VSLEEYLRAFAVSPNKHPTNPVTLRRIPDKRLITNGDINLVGLDFGTSSLRASLLEACRDHFVIGGPGRKWQILGGMDRLPYRLAKTLADNLVFNARVTAITANANAGYAIHYDHRVTHARSEPKPAEFVILAAPFSALTHVRLDGVVNTTHLRAIRSLHYDNATKIILEFSKRFWEDDGIHCGRSFTDLPIRWVYYPSKEQNQGKRGVLLASYTWGEDSLRWGSLGKEDRIRFAVRDIETLHRKDAGFCEKLVVGGMSHSWAEDEYTFGAFALFDPHQETELFDTMWTPHNKVHFAGEHTSLKHGWIEGAVESGIRAAWEIHQEVTNST
jgi:monoamine oxidase